MQIMAFSDEGIVNEQNFEYRSISEISYQTELYKRNINKYIREFEDDLEKKEEFLNIIAQKETENIELSDLEIAQIAKSIKFKGIEAATPVSVVKLDENSEIQSRQASGINSILRTRQSTNPIYIDNSIFMSGYENPIEIDDLEEGFLWSEFDVINDGETDVQIYAIIKLQNTVTEAMHDLALVKKTILAESDDAIAAGFNVPEDAENYAIFIELWDNNLDKIDEFKFPEPHVTMTVASGTSYFEAYIIATNKITLKYNNKIETYVSNGSYNDIIINEQITTPIILIGDLVDAEFSNNRIMTFDGIGLSNLIYLNLDSNRLTTFAGTGLSSLKYLTLVGNQLTNFNADLTNLITLYLYYNQLTAFDGTGLPNLKNLDLYGNYLTTFDGTGLFNLTNLYLEYNQLTTFDGTGLSSLTSLDLVCNQLTTFSGTGLSSLTSLGLIGNQLTAFDGTDLSNLTHMDLSNNQLTTFSGTGLTSLVYLYIVTSQLTAFDGTDLSNLKELYLMGNRITTFNGTGMAKLSYLALDSNQLTTFNGTGLSGLTYLYLGYNSNLSSVVIPVYSQVFDNSGLKVVDLYNTALGDMSTVNSAWNGIISNLPIRNSTYKGTLYVSNSTLRNALESSLTSKYWNVY